VAGVDQVRSLRDLIPKRAALAASGQWKPHEAVTPVQGGAGADESSPGAGRMAEHSSGQSMFRALHPDGAPVSPVQVVSIVVAEYRPRPVQDGA